MTTDAGAAITGGRTALGIEFGSTRIKAVLIGPDHAPLAVGSHDWENQFVDRVWTYSLDAVWTGLQQSFAALADDVRRRHGVELTTVGALGVSAMMHGYLAFDADGELLTPFRTWRNTNTGRAAERLSAEFGCNIPHRWSVAHLYQAILDCEEHIGRLDHLTTLAGYVHWQLTGEKVLGIGDASGMFPIDAGDRRVRRHDAGPVRRAGRRGRGRADAWPSCCPPSPSPASRPARSPRRARRCSTRPGGCGPASRSARPRVTRARGWSPPTRSLRAPATSPPGRPSSRWSCSSTSSPRCTANWTWSPRRPATRWRWCTATTGPVSWTPGSGCSREFARGAGRRGRHVEGLRDPVRRRAGRCERLRRDARLQLPLRGADHRPRGGPAALPAVAGQQARPRHLHADAPVRRPWPRSGSAWTSCRRPRACG